MPNELDKKQTEKILSDGRVLWAFLLVKGDVLQTYAYNMLEAYKNIFGENWSLMSCVRVVMRMDEPPQAI